MKHSNLINVKVENSNILDLYSGVGSFGIESISRGAEKVTFVEQDNNAISVLKENLTKLSIISKTALISNKVENFFKIKKNNKFNIFFLDPPFENKDFIQILYLIKQHKIFEVPHIIIIHREKETIDKFDNLMHIVLSKQYGRAKIIFGVLN